jgi:cytochrome c553
MNYTIFGMCLLSLAACTIQGNSRQGGSSAKNVATADRVKICVTCHDPNIKTGFAEAPALAGRPYKELVEALEKVRDYKAPQPSVRHEMSDKEIYEIATYFASIK